MIANEIPAALAGERVDRAVAFLTGCARSDATRLVDDGAVRRNGRPVRKGSERLAEGDTLDIDDASLGAVDLPEPDPTIALNIVHDDHDVVVVDKPPGLVVHPGAGTPAGTLVNAALARYPEIAAVGDPARPGVVHRLDRGTSGLLVLARTQDAHDSLVAQLTERTVDRRYVAVVWGHPEHDRGVVDAPIGRHPRHPTRMAVVAQGREARTHYHVTQRAGSPATVARVDCRLETGRTHQIRVHMSAIGHAVVGDALYGGVREQLPFDRPALHAAELGFSHPGSGERLHFRAAPPPDLALLVDSLR